MKQRLRLLIVESPNADLASLLYALDSQGFEITPAVVSTPKDMRITLDAQEWDLIICCQPVPDFPAVAALVLAKEVLPLVPFIIVSSETDLNLAVALVKLGAQDYVQKNELMRLGPVSDRRSPMPSPSESAKLRTNTS